MRREYDYTYDKKSDLDDLASSINAKKSEYGGSSMYIELARKFDNSDYLWVIYRNNLDSDSLGSTDTTGYIVLFDKSGNVITSTNFSYPYMPHCAAQLQMIGQSSTVAKFMHMILCIMKGDNISDNTPVVYAISFQLSASTGEITQTGSLSTTVCKKYFDNVTTNVFFRINGNRKLDFYFSGLKGSLYNGGRSQITMSSTTTITPTYTATAAAISSITLNTVCQLIYNDGSNNYFVTWDPSDATNTISWTSSSNYTGITRNTTTLSPFATNYKNVYILPTWDWNYPYNYTKSTTPYLDIEYLLKGMWWLTNDDYLERKYLLTDNTTGASELTSPVYRINTNVYNPSKFGLISDDGITITTMNLSTLLLEKISTISL